MYCKVKHRIQRELSHTIKLRCACVLMYMVDIYVANLILLCSLKTYLCFKTWKQLYNRTWAILFISSFFQRASEYPLISISRTLVHFFLSFFFMNNFCIAPCFFSTAKLLRDSNKNLEHLFGGYPIGHIFGVHSQYKSKTFLGGSRWNGMFLRPPPV